MKEKEVKGKEGRRGDGKGREGKTGKEKDKCQKEKGRKEDLYEDWKMDENEGKNVNRKGGGGWSLTATRGS